MSTGSSSVSAIGEVSGTIFRIFVHSGRNSIVSSIPQIETRPTIKGATVTLTPMQTRLALLTFPTPVAHQGGWDEILLVVAPLAVIGLLLWVANRRVSAQIAEQTAPEDADGDG